VSRATGSNDIYHQISATPVSEKVKHSRGRSCACACDVDLIRFGEGFVFYLVCAL
jgi:hypothetical protein